MKTKRRNDGRGTTFEDHLERRYGRVGSKRRTEFEIKAKAFAIGEIIKEERRLVPRQNPVRGEMREKLMSPWRCSDP